jgi:DNA polymerase-3 subunit beta
MKVAICRADLLEGCRLADRVLPERPVGPVAGHILLSADENGCTLHAADHDLTLRQDLTASVGSPGQALLPARTALNILREADAEELTLEARPGRLVIRGPGALFDLHVPPPALYPPGEPFPGGPCHCVAGDLLRRAIQSTLFAAGPGSSRYYLDGVLWEVEADRLRLVATDNKRLAVAEVPTLGRCEHLTPARRLLPARAVQLLTRLPTEGPVEALFGAGRAFFRLSRATLSSRYAEGSYPRWRSALPPAPRHRVALEVAPLLSAVRQAAVLREREGARLLLKLEPGRLVLESSQSGAGRARVEQEVAFWGAPVQLALAPRFLVEMLRCLEGEGTVQVELTDEHTPLLFRAGSSTHLLMPLRPEAASAMAAARPLGDEAARAREGRLV